MKEVDKKMRFRMTISFMTLVLATLANSQTEYKATILHPDWLGGSTFAYGAANGAQVGMHSIFGAGGLIWRGSPESAVYVRPFNSTGAGLTGTDGTRHAGFVQFSPVAHAALWRSDDPEDYIDLHGGGYDSTVAHGMGGGEQVGRGIFSVPAGEEFHAVLWRGSAESIVHLRPEGSTWSIARAAHSGSQVGVALVPTAQAAALWRGTAESFVNLNPPGITNAEANGVFGGQQVGRVGGIPSRAALWFGSAESFVDLNPSGQGMMSEAFGTNGKHQVGIAGFVSAGRAVRWSGSAESVFDLHQFLPTELLPGISRANFIDESGVIVGEAENALRTRRFAVMWTPVPEPATLSIIAFGLLALTLRKRRK